MAEYIEREATIELLRSLGSRDYRREKGTIQEAIKMVSFPEYTPSADVAPVRHGRWVHTDLASHWLGKDECSECTYHKKDRSDLSHNNYCPYCGAKMDLEG